MPINQIIIFARKSETVRFDTLTVLFRMVFLYTRYQIYSLME